VSRGGAYQTYDASAVSHESEDKEPSNRRDVKIVNWIDRTEPVPIALEEGKKGNLAMDILKLVLLALVRLAVCGVLKFALVVYILFLPNSPLGGVAQESDSHAPEKGPLLDFSRYPGTGGT
jgi:hypothetical protein